MKKSGSKGAGNGFQIVTAVSGSLPLLVDVRPMNESDLEVAEALFRRDFETVIKPHLPEGKLPIIDGEDLTRLLLIELLPLPA